MSKRIQTSSDMHRAITRISHEILEKNSGSEDLILVGMHSRGVPLANRIKESIKLLLIQILKRFFILKIY